jgi:hypothetical protein
MTALLRDGTTVQPTEAEIRRAIRRALDEAGCSSFEELAAQARSGRFASSRARMAWIAIGGWQEYSADS